MKTASMARAAAPTIVQLVDAAMPSAAEAPPAQGELADDEIAAARAFAAPLLAGRSAASGDDGIAHADGVASILADIGAAPSLRAAAYLVEAAAVLGDPAEVLAPRFGAAQAGLVGHARKLGELQRTANARVGGEAPAAQLERARKMLLAFARDLRVVLLRLADRLQTLRSSTERRRPMAAALADETLQLFAPLANRLGIWQIKWELEDLAFRALHPDAYREIAALVDERRAGREARIARLRAELAADLAAHGVEAEVHGRPKHLYGIWKKMQAKRLDFAAVLDVLALRVVVADVAGCYGVLGRVHERYAAVTGELDDYIARPKANGYRSLHTVVRDDDGRAVEIQIRTPEMHQHAEFGVAAHWAYKEGGSAASAGATFASDLAAARLVVLRQLLAWERDVVAGSDAEANDAAAAAELGSGASDGAGQRALFDDRIFVFTPEAAIVELAAGATPIDFAYAVHTDLGHRCRGARVDGAQVPLATTLASGQTVEIVAAKSGGPSLDWLNPELGFLHSQRSKAKVRAWFNVQAQAATVARGREAIEKLLQREGRTALKHAELATRLGHRSAEALYEIVGKDELSVRSIEALLRPSVAAPNEDGVPTLRRSRAALPAGGVLVVGERSLLTTLARCCRPAPPDRIRGYVTRGHGVAVHRAACRTFAELAVRTPGRAIDVAWAEGAATGTGLYALDLIVEAADRQGLLRDISEVLTKDKINVTGVNSRTVRAGADPTAFMTFTVEVSDAARLVGALAAVVKVEGVRSARRR